MDSQNQNIDLNRMRQEVDVLIERTLSLSLTCNQINEEHETINRKISKLQSQLVTYIVMIILLGLYFIISFFIYG